MTEEEREARLAQAQALVRLLHQQNMLQLQQEMFSEVLTRLAGEAGVDLTDINARFAPLFKDSLRALDVALSEQRARFNLGMLEWDGENAIPPQASPTSETSDRGLSPE